MYKIKTTLILVFVSVLIGCSSIKEHIVTRLQGGKDVALTQKQISELPYASSYVRVALGARGLWVLAFAEKSYFEYPQATALKWVDQSGSMLVTQSGRITKTLNFPGYNLAQVSSSAPDPLQLGLQKPSTPTTWQAVYSWGAFDAISTHHDFKVEPQADGLLSVTEVVTFKEISKQLINSYQIDSVTGRVIRSAQQVAPGMYAVELDFVKPFKG